jgi:phage-related protein
MDTEYTFAFVSEAAEREYKQLPDEIMDEFGKNFRLIQYGEQPQIPLEHLSSIGNGIMELKINGSPAFRSVFVAKYNACIYLCASQF